MATRQQKIREIEKKLIEIIRDGKLEKLDFFLNNELITIIKQENLMEKKKLLNEQILLFYNCGRNGEEKYLMLSVFLLMEQYYREIESLIDKNGLDIIWLNKHGFSNNYMYTREGHKRTSAYNYWCDTFPKNKVPSLLELGVDSSKPIKLDLYFVCKINMDVENFAKAMIDMLCEKIWHIDDVIIEKINIEKIGVCSSYDDGKIGFRVSNWNK